jgi:hypothetical protein
MDRTDALKPFRIVCIKATGARVEFSRYSTRHEAEQVRDHLAAMHCPSEIEDPPRPIARETASS